MPTPRGNRFGPLVLASFLLSLAAPPALLCQSPLGQSSLHRSSPTHSTSVRHVHILDSKTAVEIEVEGSDRLLPQTQVLTGPDRLVVDFPNALPGNAVRNQVVNRGEVKSVRVGLFQSSPPVTRVVLDLKTAQSFQVFPYGHTVIIKVTSGIPNSTLSSQLALAASKGIWVNSSADTSSPSGAMFDTSIANPAQLAEWGKMVAAYVVVQSQGKAVVQDFQLTAFPILLDFDTAFVAAVQQWCSTCKVTTNAVPAASLGTSALTSQVTSVVTRNPSTNWLIFDLGDLEIGVDAAVKAAGLSGLKIGGLTADTPNIAGLKAGTENVWTAYSLPIVAYRQVDSMARKFEGMPPLSQNLPTQLITPQNVGSLVTDSAGNYVGVSDYRTEFKKLWLES